MTERRVRDALHQDMMTGRLDKKNKKKVGRSEKDEAAGIKLLHPEERPESGDVQGGGGHAPEND